MSALSLEELYERCIKPLPPALQLRLIARTTDALAQAQGENPTLPGRSIKDLHGPGAELWRGIDVQAYVNDLRDEWDDRP